MREVKPKWIQKKMGLQLGNTDLTQLINLRFADDVLLVSSTLPRLVEMLRDVAIAARTRGLELHPDKRKIVSSLAKRRSRGNTSHAQVLDMCIKILPFSTSVKYLGRKITFDECHTAEVENWIACAWRRFMSLREELTIRRYSLRKRMKLFDTTVAATMLYGCAAWTLTKDMKSKIRRTQRKMLRMMLRSRRRVTERNEDGVTVESWVDWIKRATHSAEEHMNNFGVRDWVATQREAKRKWHSELTANGNSTASGWAYWAFHWQPEGRRKTGRPKTRWIDDI